MKPVISPNVRIRYPDTFEVGDYSIIDDYCYFSTRVRIGVCCHVANNCSIGGGPARLFVLGDFSSLSAGVRIWCASNDFPRDLVAMIPGVIGDVGDQPISGDVIFKDYTGAGANAVIMPDNMVPEGTVIGALSFVPTRFEFEPWSVYAGIPVRKIAARDRDRVLAQAKLARQRMAEATET